MRENRIASKLFFLQALEREEVIIKKTKEKVTRSEARKHLAQFHLSYELLKVINRFSRAAVPAETDPRSAEPEICYLSVPDPADDKDSFCYILH